MSDAFKGFPRDFFAFFRELKAHNERAWFEANKPRFREQVQAPMSQFIAAMAPRLAKISKHFTADPRPNGGSMFRIYRDTRFSKDKRPYKTHIAATFYLQTLSKAAGPCFYFHFTSKELLVFAGVYMPEREELLAVRNLLAERHQEFRRSQRVRVRN